MKPARSQTSSVRASFTASGGTTSAFGRDTLGGGHQQAGQTPSGLGRPRRHSAEIIGVVPISISVALGRHTQAWGATADLGCLPNLIQLPETLWLLTKRSELRVLRSWDLRFPWKVFSVDVGSAAGADMLQGRGPVRLLTLAFYMLHVVGHVNPTSTHVKYQQRKAQSERAAGELMKRSQQTCTSLDKSVHPDHPHLRHPRALSAGDKFGKALYFSGNEVLKFKDPNSVNEYSMVPREAFTVEAWVKPEGGQDNPAVIIGESSCLQSS
ncbi:hypothetical protein Bbelb_347340 [Branchiostoma belcheri]|nr:hypothetical protein Bbelb_347340 [Branchiostoma belcheri]